MALTLHGYINTTKMCAENIDAMNCAGVYTAGDLDNGVVVTLTSMNTNSSTLAIQGYEYTVTPATSATVGDVWIVASPEVGSTIDQQILSDPRYFYNAQGLPMSLKYLVDGVDCIEATAECFTNTTLPATGSTYVVIGAGGKFTAQASAPTTINQPYFTLEGLHTVTIGATEVPSAVLRFHRVPAAS